MFDKSSEMTILSIEEIEKLTGAKTASKQIAILAKNGIYHIVDHHGKPQLTWYHVNNPIKYIDSTYNQPDFSTI